MFNNKQKEPNMAKKAKKSLVRNVKFSTRLNEREKAKLDRIAKRSKLTPSEVVRAAIAQLA